MTSYVLNKNYDWRRIFSCMINLMFNATSAHPASGHDADNMLPSSRETKKQSSRGMSSERTKELRVSFGSITRVSSFFGKKVPPGPSQLPPRSVLKVSHEHRKEKGSKVYLRWLRPSNRRQTPKPGTRNPGGPEGQK